MSRLPLRQRVALVYGLIGLLLSLCFAGATFFVAEDYEAILIDAAFAGQAQAFARELARDPATPLPQSPRFAVWREADAPAAMRGLAPGIHEVRPAGGPEMHVGAYGEGAQRLVFALDVGRVETLEAWLAQAMLAIVVAGTLLSAWLGWLLSRQAIRPVAQLAAAVDALPARPVPTTLAADLRRDEIGRLAAAIDAYQQRLVDVDAVEKRFFADASHELRTPIAVIQGAVEVLQDDPGLDAGTRDRLGRIDRGVVELGALLEALLLSARGLPADRDDVDLAQALVDALARVAAAEPQAPRRLRLVLRVPRQVRAPRRWVQAILAVLLQRLLGKSPGTVWECELDADGLALRQPDDDREPGVRVQRSDLGIGLMFVERLCRDLGWQLAQTLDGDGRLAIRLAIRDVA